MRSRALPVVGFGVLALSLTASFAAPANAADGPSASTSGGSTTVTMAPLAKVCAQNNGTPNGDGVTAQDFEAAYDAYDSYGGADFTIKKTCKAKSVQLVGSTSGGSSTAVNISIHKDAGGVPDKTKKGILKGFPVSVNSTGPNHDVKIPATKLKKGKYWLVVNTSQDFATSGQWFWSATNERSGYNDAWKNPGNGFATGCTGWDQLDNCLFFAYDYLFTVGKK